MKSSRVNKYIYESESIKECHAEFFIDNDDMLRMWCVELKPENQNQITESISRIIVLKTALKEYFQKVGRYPFLGNKTLIHESSAYCADEVLSYDNPEKNVLVSNFDPDSEIYDYEYKLRGPILAVPPSEFMFDAWGNKIQYVAEGNDLWLWSYGPDGKPAAGTIAEVLGKTDSDDMIMSVSKFSTPFN